MWHISCLYTNIGEVHNYVGDNYNFNAFVIVNTINNKRRWQRMICQNKKKRSRHASFLFGTQSKIILILTNQGSHRHYLMYIYYNLFIYLESTVFTFILDFLSKKGGIQKRIKGIPLTRFKKSKLLLKNVCSLLFKLFYIHILIIWMHQHFQNECFVFCDKLL